MLFTFPADEVNAALSSAKGEPGKMLLPTAAGAPDRQRQNRFS